VRNPLQLTRTDLRRTAHRQLVVRWLRVLDVYPSDNQKWTVRTHYAPTARHFKAARVNFPPHLCLPDTLHVQRVL
jgi:hypothetical protein